MPLKFDMIPVVVYAEAHGISDRFITDEEFRKMKARGRIKA